MRLDIKSLPRLRDLGHAEQYCTVRSHLGIYLNVCVTAVYQKHTNCSLRQDLFSALAHVISKHPILSAIPVDIETSKPFFVRLSQIDLDQVVSFTDLKGCLPVDESNEILDSFLEDQHNRKFEYETPLTPFWRLHVLLDSTDTSKFVLVFVFHHCIADTQSALVFHRDLEAALSSSTPSEMLSIVPTPVAQLLPPLEQLVSLETSNELLSKMRSDPCHDSNAWSGERQSLPVTTRFKSVWFSTTATEKLYKAARAHGSSITAATQTIIATCLFGRLPSTYHKLTTDCAMSLRRWFPAPIDGSSMGCFVGSCSRTYHRSPFSWDEARQTKESIEEIVSRPIRDMPVCFLSHVSDKHAWFRQKIGKPRTSAFELSNVGRLSSSVEKNAKYSIESLLFSQSASACSGAIKVSAATGPDGRLTLGFTWQEGIVEDELVMKLADDVKCTVVSIGQSLA